MAIHRYISFSGSGILRTFREGGHVIYFGGTVVAYIGSSQIGYTIPFSGSDVEVPTGASGFSSTSGFQITDVTITSDRTVDDNPNHTITVHAGTGGSLRASASIAAAGTTITLTPTANTGYSFSGYSSSPNVTISNNKFTMPGSNITITASFTKNTYSITKSVSPSGAGTVTTSRNTAQYGDQVTVSQSASSGYVFNYYATSPANLISNNKFTMPAGNVTVTAYYRKISTGSLTTKSLTGGQSVTLTITTESNAYSHKYKLSFGTGMETSLTSVAAGTKSVSIAIPLNWSANIPNSVTKTGGTLVLETYNGNTKLGQSTITGLTYNVPATVKPTVGAITTSIARTIDETTYANVGNYYVQNHCGVRVQASASGDQGSTITSMTVSIGNYSGSYFNKTVLTGSIDFTSGLLGTSGDVTITVTTTDSRGRIGSNTATITVSAYSAPTGSLRCWRVDNNGDADDMGTYGKYQLTKRYSEVGSNTFSWTMAYSGGSVNNPGDTGDLLPGDRKTFSDTQEYEFTLTLQDSFETIIITTKLPSARFIMAFDASGNKIGLMKYPNKTIPSGKARTFEISADTQIYIGDMTLEDYIRSIT